MLYLVTDLASEHNSQFGINMVPRKMQAYIFSMIGQELKSLLGE